MKRGKLAISLFTIVLIMVAVSFGRYEMGKHHFPFSVKVAMDGHEVEIPCMKMSDGYTVFLPAYGKQADVTILSNPVYDVRIGDQLLTTGLDCSQFPEGSALPLLYDSEEGIQESTVTFLRSANVGTIYIDVPSGSMSYIHEAKGNEERGEIQVYSADGKLWYMGHLDSIRGRGNATWEYRKKPYSLTLSDSGDLLGMGAAKEWILLANATDPTHLRNKIAYDLAEEVGLPYSPECKWVDLYLNGNYAGLYLLTERNEIHPQRIAADSDGFLVSMELEYLLLEKNHPYICTSRGTVLRIHHSDLSQEELRGIWESAENAIFSEDGIDLETGLAWTDLIDVDSWARKYLLEELMGNYDAGSVSQYFYYEKASGKIYAGPVWDMDNSMGNSQWTSAVNAILAGREHLWSDADVSLYDALLKKAAFRERAAELYRENYRPALLHLCETGLEQYAAEIREPEEMNRKRWSGKSPEADIAELRTYLKSRMSFLEAFWENRDNFVTVHAWKPYTIWGCWAISPGEKVDWLDAEEGYVWIDLETGEPFDMESPVYKDIILRKEQVAETEGRLP